MAAGPALRADVSDPRRFPRMLDRLHSLCTGRRCARPFRARVLELLQAYCDITANSGEARRINDPPRVALFERPLPPGGADRYPCTVEDIRGQLARVPEYEIEGLWAIGLFPQPRGRARAYGTYYRWFPPIGKPVILIHPAQDPWTFTLRRHGSAGYTKDHRAVERRYGLQTERSGSSVVCHWPADGGRRFVVQHVLLHEIGHHVQYQERWRAGLTPGLPAHIMEQFAEDYALRFHRVIQE